MRRVIRLGDRTSHGGEVVSAASNYTIMGKAVARMGDMATCPIKGHGACEIIEGDPTWTIDGRNVALEGHKLQCGAELISSCGEVGRSYEGDEGAGLGSGIASSAAAHTPASTLTSDEHDFDRLFKVIDQDGAPVGDIAVALAAPSSQRTEVQTAGDGTTPLVSGNEGERTEFFLIDGQEK